VRLLLDEMLSPEIARRMRDGGHDVVAVRERTEWRGLPDAEVAKVARAEGRVIVTNNVRDFRPLLAQALAPGGAGHHGVVFIPSDYRRTRSDIGRIVLALGVLLQRFPEDAGMFGAEAWL